ncbi:MAG: Fe-S cluster biogenesis protein NfuA [Candidatus Azotimanducaceae bacterium]|jgi:Fe-S cluster biogenesis protein NfuA
MVMKEEKDILLRIEEALDQVRPYLKTDGGDISFVELTDDFVVKVKLLGACTDCSVNQMTLKAGVEQSVKKYAPEVKSVINVSVGE